MNENLQSATTPWQRPPTPKRKRRKVWKIILISVVGLFAGMLALGFTLQALGYQTKSKTVAAVTRLSR